MATVTVNPNLEDTPSAHCHMLIAGSRWVYVKLGESTTLHLPDENRRCLAYGRELVAALTTALDTLEAKLTADKEAHDGEAVPVEG